MSDDTLQQQVDEQESRSEAGFGTFAGVFVPTLLTILGVIMYLRLGWVVGSVGLLSGWLIIVVAFAITGFTGLSLSSITTNIRVGAGGAYSMISQSLGLEVGGSISIPLYFSQALAVAMYVFGFREGWLYIFPHHPAILVDLVVFAMIFGIAFISAGLAFRVQYLILAVIVGSLVSVAAAAVLGSMTEPINWTARLAESAQRGAGPEFWTVFAVFFPAATGIMAGANMSGDLENPRRSIPVGTLGAIGLSLVVYLALGYWLARSATAEELVDQFTIMVDKAAWGPIVLAGLLGATFSSALTSTVGAPRILQALGTHRILPGGEWLAETTEAGEPRHAMWLTGVIVFAALMLRDLNAVAPMITLFFLITYSMINVVVLIEQSLGLVSFRPTLRLPRIIPLAGATGCLFAMFIVNPAFSLVAVTVVLLFYGLLVRRSLDAPFGDVRSGLFVAVAEWAAKRVTDLPATQERAWKPNLLVPVVDTRDLRGTFRFLHNVTHPKGTIRLVGVSMNERGTNSGGSIKDLAHAFRQEGVFATWSTIDSDEFREGLAAGMDTLGGAFFRPNILFLTLPKNEDHAGDLQALIQKASRNELGVLLFADHPQAKLGRRRTINLWIRDRSPEWRLSMDIGNLDLGILVSYKLLRNWQGKINLLTAVEDEGQLEKAETFLRSLTEVARIPDAEIHVGHGDFSTFLAEAPQGDISVFGLPEAVDFDQLKELRDGANSACIFVQDSGQENALA